MEILSGKHLEWLEKMVNDHFWFFVQSLMPEDWYDDKFHRELCDFLQYGGNRKVVVLARTHLKTTICAVFYPLWRASRHTSLRVLEVSNTAPNAEKTAHSVRALVESNTLYQALFPQCIPNFNKVRWSDRCACLNRKEDYPEGTFESAGVGSNIIRRHFNLIIEDDTVAPKKDDMTGDECMPSREDIEQAVGFHRLTAPLFIGEEGDEQLVIGCLVGDSKVLMSDGSFNNIKDVKVGSEVVSFENGKPKNCVVSAMIPQGISEVLEVRSNNSIIKATPNHPFLVWDGCECKFVTADKLNEGDYLVVYVKKYDGVEHTFSNGLVSDGDLMWLLGFMFGDGWVSITHRERNIPTYNINVAESIYPELNAKVKRLFQHYFEANLKSKGNGSSQVCNKEFANILVELGMDAGAKHKSIPNWIFSLPYLQRRSFILGLLEADGWKLQKGEGYGIELSNATLIEQLKLLGITSGMSSSNVFFRSRYVKAPSSKSALLSETWHIFLYSLDTQHNKGKRYKTEFNYLPLSPEFGLEKVMSVKSVGDMEVYDLTVEGTHNFVANGLVVHNTRWADYDHIRWIKDNEKYAFFDRPAEDGSGKPSYKRFSRERLDSIRISMGTYLYSSLYLNQPLAKEFMSFNPDWVEYYEEEQLPTDGDVIVTVDPADPPTGKKRQDYSAIVSCKHSKSGIYVRRYRRKRLTDAQVIKEAMEVAEIDGATKIRIEADRYAHLKYGFKDVMDREKKFYIIEEVKTRGRNKQARIRQRLQPLYENRVIKHKRGMRELEAELYSFPNGIHDDLIDALAWQVEGFLHTEYKQPKPPVKSMGKRMSFTLDEIRKSVRGRNRMPYPFQRQLEEAVA